MNMSILGNIEELNIQIAELKKQLPDIEAKIAKYEPEYYGICFDLFGRDPDFPEIPNYPEFSVYMGLQETDKHFGDACRKLNSAQKEEREILAIINKAEESLQRLEIAKLFFPNA